MKLVFFFITLISFNVSADPIEKEFEKSFNVPMPERSDDGSIYIAPKDSDVLPVTDKNARMVASIKLKSLCVFFTSIEIITNIATIVIF